MLSHFVKCLFSKLGNKNNQQKKLTQNIPVISDLATNKSPCCSDKVHIAYRGVSDDRLYIAYERKWSEVKFFRPKNLRVYCQQCRHRIY